MNQQKLADAILTAVREMAAGDESFDEADARKGAELVAMVADVFADLIVDKFVPAPPAMGDAIPAENFRRWWKYHGYPLFVEWMRRG